MHFPQQKTYAELMLFHTNPRAQTFFFFDLGLRCSMVSLERRPKRNWDDRKTTHSMVYLRHLFNDALADAYTHGFFDVELHVSSPHLLSA